MHQFFNEVEAKFTPKGGGYLILHEQTRNVGGHAETMDICSNPNPFVLRVVFEVAYGCFFLCFCTCFMFLMERVVFHESYHITLMVFYFFLCSVWFGGPPSPQYSIVYLFGPSANRGLELGWGCMCVE